jgi:hypothetical protein
VEPGIRKSPEAFSATGPIVAGTLGPRWYVPVTPSKVPVPVSALIMTLIIFGLVPVKVMPVLSGVFVLMLRVSAWAPEELPISPNDAIASASPTTWLFKVLLLLEFLAAEAEANLKFS